MRWIASGPDLPPKLLQAQEDGDLILFCGAGISYPLGLKGFGWLVTRIYTQLSEPLAGLEEEEFTRRNYDRVLGLLEARLGGDQVRRKVIEALEIERPPDLRTHGALLTLATNRDGQCRIVTTNFDQGFQLVKPEKTIIDAAPKLPLAKKGAWDSIVHLHGLIGGHDPGGRTLVLTSADFGSAYLTERWASRFVSDLFRRFKILFVGYSVEDPVVRYMMDAFAADRALGEGINEAYILAPNDGDGDSWKAKGVIPILYDKFDNHRALHETLVRWADCHRNGLRGKSSVVVENASSIPTRPYSEDAGVTQIVWAVSEPSGHAANVFAKLDPLPPVEWLDVFTEHRLLQLKTENRETSLVDRGQNSNGSPLHPVTRALLDWILRHLDKAETLSWVLAAGCELHREFRDQLRRRLLDTALNLPTGLKKVWDVLASESAILRSTVGSQYAFRLCEPLSTGDWHSLVKGEFLREFAPFLTLRPAVLKTMFPDEKFDGSKVRHFAETELVLRSRNHAKHLREAIDKSPHRRRILTDVADDATSLLKRAMELFDLVEEADPLRDNSYSAQPSISPHEQNQSYKTWTVLIELTRDGWREVLAADRETARRLVERWRSIPYPVFRRLVFYAMAESDLFTPEECLIYLLENEGWWIWSIYVNRERFRLLDALWPKLCLEDSDRLVEAILIGPPHSMFRENIPEGEVVRSTDRSKWEILAKLKRSGRDLPTLGSRHLAELQARYPKWELQEGDRDEFLIWSGDAEWVGSLVTNPDEFLQLPNEAVLPRLAAITDKSSDDLDRWRRLVSADLERAVELLRCLPESGCWPAPVWDVAIEDSVREKRSLQVWTIRNLLLAAPDTLINQLTRTLARLLRSVAHSPESKDDDSFWQIWDRLQPEAFAHDGDPPTDPLFAAINCAAGDLAEALVTHVSLEKPLSHGDLPESVWDRLTGMTTGVNLSFGLARVILSSRLAWLYNINPAWVRTKLLPYFNWINPEAPAVWQGFLWQLRVSPELWPQIQVYFLEAFKNKGKLGQGEEQIARLFAFICIDQPGWIEEGLAREVIRGTDAKGRTAVAAVIRRRLEGAEDRRETMWKGLIGPWLQRVWPKTRSTSDPGSSHNLAMAATYCGDEFPNAVAVVAPFLAQAEHSSLFERRICETNYPERFPAEVLQLAALVVNTNTNNWPDPGLRELLDRIKRAKPELNNHPDFRRLDEFILKRNL